MVFTVTRPALVFMDGHFLTKERFQFDLELSGLCIKNVAWLLWFPERTAVHVTGRLKARQIWFLSYVGTYFKLRVGAQGFLKRTGSWKSHLSYISSSSWGTLCSFPLSHHIPFPPVSPMPYTSRNLPLSFEATWEGSWKSWLWFAVTFALWYLKGATQCLAVQNAQGCCWQGQQNTALEGTSGDASEGLALITLLGWTTRALTRMKQVRRPLLESCKCRGRPCFIENFGIFFIVNFCINF